MRIPSDADLVEKYGLKSQWFTGEQWANGTAQAWHQREFWKAVHRANGTGKKAFQTRKMEKDLDTSWFDSI